MVLAPTTDSEPMSPPGKLALSWYTAVQSAPPTQLALPSLDANTYTCPAVESTTGLCTIPVPPSALEKSNCPELATNAVPGPTRYRMPPVSATNIRPEPWSKTGLVKAVGVNKFTCTGHPALRTSAGTPLNTTPI